MRNRRGHRQAGYDAASQVLRPLDGTKRCQIVQEKRILLNHPDAPQEAPLKSVQNIKVRFLMASTRSACVKSGFRKCMRWGSFVYKAPSAVQEKQLKISNTTKTPATTQKTRPNNRPMRLVAWRRSRDHLHQFWVRFSVRDFVQQSEETDVTARVQASWSIKLKAPRLPIERSL